MNPTTRGTLSIAIGALLVISACDGDEYTEDGQLVEKTNVRVVGVDFGQQVDSSNRLTDESDTFAPSDTIYASVRTKGSSPKTVLGVRWKNATGDEINMNNIVIRPSGDTSTLFALHHLVDLDTGQYSLDMRVNGKVVKTASFTVSKTAEPHRVSSRKTTQERETSFGAVRPFLTKTFARLTGSVASLFDRASGDQSPFEWKGLRAGMRFSRLDRLSKPGTPWRCTPFLLSSVGLDRYTAAADNDLGGGRVIAMVDTVGQRVVSVNYSRVWTPPGTGRRVDFERDLTGLAAKWDSMPGVIRRVHTTPEGSFLAEWTTPDSVWTAKMSYHKGLHDPKAVPEDFEIEEINWFYHVEARMSDSLKGQTRNPESAFYRTPNMACAGLLRGQKWVSPTQ
jgi:hypothetical protein